MTGLKFLWAVKMSSNSGKFILSPPCQLYAISPTEKLYLVVMLIFEVSSGLHILVIITSMCNPDDN